MARGSATETDFCNVYSDCVAAIWRRRMSLVKQFLISLFVIVFAGLGWFAFSHRDLLLTDLGIAGSADAGAGATPGQGGAGGPTGSGGNRGGGSSNQAAGARSGGG